MYRTAGAMIAGWLTLAPIAWAQSDSTNGVPYVDAKPLPNLPPNLSAIDRTPELPDMPLEMPTIVIPRLTSERKWSAQPPVAPVTPPIHSPSTEAIAAPTTPIMTSIGSALDTSSCCPSFDSTCDPCGPMGPCGPQGRVWGGIEYLLWTTSGMNVPPLVTSSRPGTPIQAAGILGDPRTSVLFGGGNVNDDFRSGIRAYSGMWLDDCQTCGIESSLFYMEPGNDSGAFPSFTNTMILARPFVDVNGRPDAQVVGFPNVLAGGVWVNTQTTYWGSDVNFRKNLFCGYDYRLDFLGGYRYLEMTDSVSIAENRIGLDPNTGTPLGVEFLINESFRSKNTFNGGQIGLAGEVRRGRFFVSGRGLIALGNTCQQIEIAGVTRFVLPGQLLQQYTGGLLAQPTNIGKYEFDSFSVVPEATVSVGYNVTDGVRAYVGYTFLYWNNVTRAGNHIDTVVNTSQIPNGVLVGPARPAFGRQETDFWAQGINFGLEIRF